jgi:hypothetical protein
VEAPTTWGKQMNQLSQRTRRYRRPMKAKNGPIGFYYKLFFRFGWKQYILYIYIYINPFLPIKSLSCL